MDVLSTKAERLLHKMGGSTDDFSDDWHNPALAAAVGVPSAKLGYDLARIKRKLAAWADVTRDTERTAMRKPSISVREADSLLRQYINAGRDVAKTSFMGLPAGEWTARFQSAPYDLARLNPFISRATRSNLAEKSRVAREHYKLYLDPKVSDDVLVVHHLRDLEGFNKLKENLAKTRPDLLKLFTPDVHKILKEPGSLPNILKRLRASGNGRVAALLRKNLTSTKENLLEPVVMSLDSPSALQKGYTAPYMYLRGSRLPLRILGAGAGAGVALSSGILLATLMRRLKEKTAALTSEDSRDIALSSIGAGLLGKGLHGIYTNPSRPEALAVTYGDPTGVGSGHKQPGRAIAEKLRAAFSNDPEFQHVRIDEIARNPRGVLRGGSHVRPYDLLINTGFGSEIAPWHESFVHTGAGRRPTGIDMPINFRRYLGYMTDLPRPVKVGPLGVHMPQTSTAPALAGPINPLKAGMLTYGPKSFGTYFTGALQTHHLSPGLTPAIDSKVVDVIMENNLRGSVESALGELGKVRDLGETSRKLLPTLTGKKIITISGSGRGDMVASRALHLQSLLRRSGLDKEYRVLALMAGGASNKGAVALLEASGVPVAGYLPQALFNKLQGSSFLNWGSTGTSSLTENLLHKNVQAIPEAWNRGRKSLGSAERALFRALNPTVRGPQLRQALSGLIPNVDVWNAGNIEYALGLPGVLKANNARDIVAFLQSPSQRATVASGITPRVSEQYRNYVKGNEELLKVVKDTLRKIPKQRLMMSAGAAGAGVGLLATVYMLHRKDGLLARIRRRLGG